MQLEQQRMEMHSNTYAQQIMQLQQWPIPKHCQRYRRGLVKILNRLIVRFRGFTVRVGLKEWAVDNKKKISR